MPIHSSIKFKEAQLEDLCRRWRIRRLSVFGSAIRKDFRKTSDIDLIVEFDEGAIYGFIAFQRLEEELSRLFRRPVDLFSRRGIEQGGNPVRRREILANPEVIYRAS